ncbi:MAG: ATP-binding protein, partial [Trebonia sp.]
MTQDKTGGLGPLRVNGIAGGSWAPPTSFVGRTTEVAELAGLMDEHRLVTVTGPGGVGKTRLAADVAAGVVERFPDGIWFVGLDSVTDATRVPAEVMAVLGVQQIRGKSPTEILAEALAPYRLLLVVDNCEHLLTPVAELCYSLLNATDDLDILTTSRVQLGLAGEARYRLAPLELPASGSIEDVVGSAAGELFLERTRRADPSFALSSDNASSVARVVTRLDGMPLAIELAAARVEALGMAGLADRIDDALRLLTGRNLLAAARHKSLAAVASWSYDLLSGTEQRVFRRLAVFPGPFTLAAAKAVAGPEAPSIVPG